MQPQGQYKLIPNLHALLKVFYRGMEKYERIIVNVSIIICSLDKPSCYITILPSMVRLESIKKRMYSNEESAKDYVDVSSINEIDFH